MLAAFQVQFQKTGVSQGEAKEPILQKIAVVKNTSRPFSNTFFQLQLAVATSQQYFNLPQAADCEP